MALSDFRFTTVKHWSEDQNFSPRAYFRDTTDPAQLIISNVDMADADTYKCRVDFRQSQTVTTEVSMDLRIALYLRHGLDFRSDLQIKPKSASRVETFD